MRCDTMHFALKNKTKQTNSDLALDKWRLQNTATNSGHKSECILQEHNLCVLWVSGAFIIPTHKR